MQAGEKTEKKYKAQRQKVRKFFQKSLEDKVAYINRYNEKNGTCYSYGKFTALLRYGNIEI